MKPGAHAGFVRRSGGGWEAVALFRSIKWPNARRSAHSRSWAKHRIDALESLKVMVR